MKLPLGHDVTQSLDPGPNPAPASALIIRPWKKQGSRSVGDFRIFQLRADRVISPRTGAEHEMYVIETVDWVNIVALTPDDRLVMVEQYRHGSDTVELEIPGGMIDSDDPSPLEAGLRELREETGYEGQRAHIIGRVFPNPAIQANTCYTVLVHHCHLRHAIQLDHGEDLATRLVPVADIPQLVAAGRIQHSLVVVALYYFDLWRRGFAGNEPAPALTTP
jgi:ADP-ribose pyrophosphatase